MTGTRTLLDRTFGLPDLPALRAVLGELLAHAIEHGGGGQLDITRHRNGATTTMTMNIPVART
jgi:hypothetical protein